MKQLWAIFREYYLSALSVLALVIIWELGVHLLNTPIYLLPAPSQIFIRLFTTPTLMYHAWVTLQEIILGFLLGAVVAIVLATSMSEFKTLEKAFYPLVVVSQSFPKEALAPLFLIWLGYGIMSKVVIAALISFFPVMINTIRGLRSVNPLAVDLMRSMAASRRSIFLKLRAPTALPYTFAGLKAGIVLSVVGAIVGEFVGASAGIGHVILVANSQLATDLLFASLFVLGATAVILFVGFDIIEKKVLYWTEDVTSPLGESKI